MTPPRLHPSRHSLLLTVPGCAWAAALVTTLLVAARTRIDPALFVLSSHNGAHSGDPGAVVWTAAIATLGTARSWALSRG